ncbi:hypothetical protein [Deinococcus daejeonensis]|uniref:HTH cro/C1-type domain-containing protein n=1 Tax=Deinococcus daejeonensis TaxID=1007098 RepID=A0ABQ2IQL7_9DEIO|nr:hypothetical protein [Deinococcus daejeonensis]AWT35873.1 hypothetical protein DM785_10105 [Deinococcus actinosclerus]GGN27373.1 hypothetical protein GCM10010842_00240 [Deinococcus daejeonensis]
MKTQQPPALRGQYRNGRPAHFLGYGTPCPVPYAARVTVREACEARGLTVYQVAMSGYGQGTLDPGTVYRLARGDTSRIDLGTLATVAGIMHRLTGEAVTVADLLSLEVTGEEE